MKLVTYVDEASAAPRLGALSRDEADVVDLQRAAESVRGKPDPRFADMIAFLEGGGAARSEAAELLEKAGDACKVPAKDAKLLAPLRPRTMRDTACYEGHLVNSIKSGIIMRGEQPPETVKLPKIWYELPLFYKSNLNSIVGPDDDVAFPEGERFKDYELELAVVIGKQGKNIRAKDAMSHVGGYTIFNDFSARMTQLREMPSEFHVGPGISKDFANGLGPCLVTPDAFDPATAAAVVRVNGEERSRGTTGGAYHTIDRVIEYVSNNTMLYPGDVIAMGTIENGAGLELMRPLAIGDTVELEVEGIGALRNRIVPPEVAKLTNRFGVYKRYVVATKDGKSDVVIDDYADVTRSKYGDLWKATEMPARKSATVEVDQGNEPFEHEAPHGGSTFRYIEINPDMKNLPAMAALPPARKKFFLDVIQDLHREIGTHYIPTEEDVAKHLSVHKTDSLNLFVCLGGLVISMNDDDDIELKPGDAFVQVGSMHGWSFKGDPPCYVGGLLVDGDPATLLQLDAPPVAKLTSSLKRFKRYVSATLKNPSKAIGRSRVVLDDFAPNEAELRDASGKHVGWAGDIWRTLGPQADMSCRVDPVDGPMADAPPRGGINYRMVELLPGGTLETNPEAVNYWSVIRGELTARTDGKAAVLKAQEHLVQLRSKVRLENAGKENVLFAHFMLDAAAP